MQPEGHETACKKIHLCYLSGYHAPYHCHRQYDAVVQVLEDGTIRPLYLYTVDADEFVVNKLLDRGSLSATTMVTNVQDFITIVARGLGIMD